MVDVDKHTGSSAAFIDMFEAPPTIERFMSIPSTSSSPDTGLEEEEEDLADYKENGYHPVEIGSIYNDKYQIVRKLGWGHFSTVWLARVLKASPNKFVAIKIMRSAAHYTEAAWDEVEVLERVKSADTSHPGHKHVVTIEDTFVHVGPHGKHVCMVFEVLGASLLSLMRRFNQNGIPEPLVKQITKQVCLGLDYLHRVCGIIHTDLKPENVLIEVPGLERLLEQHGEDTDISTQSVIKVSRPLGNNHDFDTNTEIKVKIADLGNGCWANRHFSNDIQTREYRAPEVILGSKWGASVDIWSLACMVFELITGDYLFEPQAGARFSKNDDHIAQIIELLGRLPLSLLIKGQWTQLYFEQNGQLRNIFHLEEWSLSDVFVDKYGYSPETAKELCDFLVPMLALNPGLRVDAGGMSNHTWLKDAPPNVTIDRPPQGSGEDIKGWSSISTDLPTPENATGTTGTTISNNQP